MKHVVLLPLAAKALRKHRADAERILSKIEAYAAIPASLANKVKSLQGSSALRLRVGGYRVIFEETDSEIIVTKSDRAGPFMIEVDYNERCICRHAGRRGIGCAASRRA